MENKWKTIAIVFIILFIIENMFIGYMIYLGNEDIKKETECLWDICGEHPYAEYLDNVCYCYDYDLFGELVLDKTEVMK